MDLKKFDSTLKSALDNIEVPFDPSTWAALENRLDALPAPDAVDKALRPTLERMETSFDAGSWSALASRMDGIARVRRLRMTKAAELAIFLLLLLNLKGFFGVVESVTNPAPVKKEAPGPVAKAKSSKLKKQVPGAPLNDSTTGTGTQTSFSEQVVAFVHNIAASLISNPEGEVIDTEANTPQVVAAQTNILDSKSFYTQTGLMKFPVSSMLPALPAEPVLFAGTTVEIPGITGLDIPKIAGKSRFYAASFGSFDKNHVQQSEYANKTNGYGAGLAVGYRKGKWGVESGVSYSGKNYKPKRVNEEYENDPFNGISFFYTDKVEAEVFSVPVKVTRRIAKMGKTSAHAVAGVTANFATSKRYGYSTVHYPPPIPIPNPNPNTPSIVSFPAGNGVLENGGLANNAYATADLGLRVEQSLGKRYVAFIEPIYKKSLGGGLGPTASRLNTFSIQAGVMASL